MEFSRREFLSALVASAMASKLPAQFQAQAQVKFGYAGITWGGRDLQAIDDTSAVGFTGIQLRPNVLDVFAGRPHALRDLLSARQLTFVALSSGSLGIDPAKSSTAIDDYVARAPFLHDAGGKILQITDERPSRDRDVTPADCVALGRLLTEIGRRTADIGIPIAYHPHMGTIGERPGDSDRVLDASDPFYVSLLLDVAHYLQGAGDPARAIRAHADRLLLVHLKDVKSCRVAAATGSLNSDAAA